MYEALVKAGGATVFQWLGVQVMAGGTEGAARGVETIATGLKWRRVRPRSA